MSASIKTVKFIASVWLCCFYTAATPIVNIQNGTLEGTVLKTRNGKEFFAFKGIPYALPPIGELRFQPPRPPSSWHGILSATENGPICTQKDIYTHQEHVVGQEDCLYLNVFTPKIQNNKIFHPVMVWIHGGGWLAGSGQMYGPNFFLDHDVVLVTSNYRLGAIGFLSTGDMVIPGNMGMKDQVQMLRWVQENIAAFGGDPNSVTIFGESAGGASVHYHMMSHLSKGLFHRGISQSGSPLNPWAFRGIKAAKKNAERLAIYLGCSIKSSTELVNCLRKKNAIEIIEAQKIFQIFDYDPMIPFRTVPEPDHSGAFLTNDPIEYLKNGNVADIPWMTGFTSHEGAIRVSALYGSKQKKYIEELNEKWLELAPITCTQKEMNETQLKAEDFLKIRKFYFGDKPIDESSKWKLIDMYSDGLLNLGVTLAIRYHLEALSSPVYFYYFAYKGSASWSTLFGDPHGDYGVCHADELNYLFPLAEKIFPNIPVSKEDDKMIDIMISLWYNFAKTGNPTPKITQSIPLKWKPVRTKNLEYLSIESSKKIRMSSNLDEERLQFWKNINFPENKNGLSKEEL